MNIHWIDIVISGTLLIMFALSCWRGLIKEAFSLGSLFISILIANQFNEMLAPHLNGMFSTTLVSQVAAFICIFIVSVFLLRLIGNLIQKKFINDSSALTYINRVGGGALGLAKGMLILIIVLIPVMNIPYVKDFVYDNSKLVGYVESSAVLLTSITTGESIAKKVRDDGGMFNNFREETRKVYKKAQKSVTQASKAVLKSKAIKTVKEKSKDLAHAAKELATKHSAIITETDKNELDNILENITK